MVVVELLLVLENRIDGIMLVSTIFCTNPFGSSKSAVRSYVVLGGEFHSLQFGYLMTT